MGEPGKMKHFDFSHISKTIILEKFELKFFYPTYLRLKSYLRQLFQRVLYKYPRLFDTAILDYLRQISLNVFITILKHFSHLS